ncbi:APC family permease [Pseudoclavibacter helvolus]|uniref:Amino acid transporter n=1 Tax=Pseudoclavibacter helvolus TaxID=255205 RepID=A0A7W4UP48_9MICO|nr:APC family permease [Pseudoclavibacter helvolus]MBB2958029.1 amino acid transporter [Pseudoclavibacter helvolus]
MSTEQITAAAQAEHLPKRMRWFDGFAMAMTMPAALIATLGASIAGLGGWGAAVLWAISMLLAMGVNWIYTELATMFPDSSGGIAHYAAEAWKKRAPWVAPLAGVGYWLPWGTNLATYGAVTGSLVMAQWFPDQDWVLQLGPISITFPVMVGLIVIGIMYLINVIGVRVTMTFVYVTAAILMIPLFVFIVFPLFQSDWAPMDLTWNLHGIEGLHTAIVWLYIMAWTTFGIEVCATFAPEYRDSVKDTTRAIKASVLFCLGVFFLVPLTLGGYAGEAAIAEDPATFFVASFANLVGGASDFMVVCLIASLLLIMTTSVADASRVLFNMGKEGVTVRGLGVLNKRGVPLRSLNVMLVMNVVILVVLQNPLAIIVTGNLGYILTHLLAVSGFFLLRKDRPDAERPIKLPRFFVPLSIVLSVILAIILVVGATGFSVTGYGGFLELGIALGLLALGVVIWFFVQRGTDRRAHPPTPDSASTQTVGTQGRHD